MPMPVLTTEQYCALLLTTSFSRFSMKSREVSAHGAGRVERVSNLYPTFVSPGVTYDRGSRALRLTPELHHLQRRTSPGFALAFISPRVHLGLMVFLNET